MLAKAKAKPGTSKYKFEIQVPMGIKQALRFDKLNGNTLWQDTIAKELQQLTGDRTFRLPEPGEDLSEYKKIPYHIVFDIKFGLRRKARLIASGNWTNPEKDDIYSGVVVMESVRTGFLVGELNGLTCCAGDVGNAFLYGRTKDKVYIIAGPEFGKELEGKVLIIFKSLCGLRASVARFRENIVERLRTMGFTPSKSDLNFFMCDKGDHYEYLGTYVDDVLVWSKDSTSVIEMLKKTYVMKGVGIPGR